MQDGSKGVTRRLLQAREQEKPRWTVAAVGKRIKSSGMAKLAVSLVCILDLRILTQLLSLDVFYTQPQLFGRLPGRIMLRLIGPVTWPCSAIFSCNFSAFSGLIFHFYGTMMRFWACFFPGAVISAVLSESWRGILKSEFSCHGCCNWEWHSYFIRRLCINPFGDDWLP